MTIVLPAIVFKPLSDYNLLLKNPGKILDCADCRIPAKILPFAEDLGIIPLDGVHFPKVKRVCPLSHLLTMSRFVQGVYLKGS